MNSDQNNHQSLTTFHDPAPMSSAVLKARDLQTELNVFNKISAELEHKDLSRVSSDKLLKMWFDLKESIDRSARIIAEKETPNAEMFPTIASFKVAVKH